QRPESAIRLEGYGSSALNYFRVANVGCIHSPLGATTMAFRRGLVSISIFEASDLDPVIREQREPLRPDGLYPIPYPLNYGTSTDFQGNNTKYLLPTFASNVARSFSVRLEDHGFNSGWATTTIQLTPSLADEEVRHLAREVYRT